MSRSLLKSGILVLSMSFMLADASMAANTCAKIFKAKEAVAKMSLAAISYSRTKNLKMELSKAEYEQLNKLVEQTFGAKLIEKVTAGDKLNVPELVLKLANMSIEKGGTRTEQSDRVALISRSLDPVTAKMTLDQRKQVNFTFAKAMLDIEAFKAEEYIPAASISMTAKSMKYVHVGDFVRFTKSYIDKTAEFNAVPDNGQGILEFKDIREIEIYNLFPVEFKGHDVRHVHFSIGHPLATGVMWASARSSVWGRWVLMGGLFEGVDTAQYGWERNMTNRMRNKGYDLETAMLELARMSSTELKALSQEVGADYIVEIFKDFKPSRVQQYGPEGLSGKGLAVEVMLAVEAIEANLTPENTKYTNYDRQPPVGGATVMDHSIH